VPKGGDVLEDAAGLIDEAIFYEQLPNDLHDLEEQERILVRLKNRKGMRSDFAESLIQVALPTIRRKIKEIKKERLSI